MSTPRGFSARARREYSTNSGTMTVRAQYDTLSRWNGNQRGSSMASTRATGQARQGTWPNMARV